MNMRACLVGVCWIVGSGVHGEAQSGAFLPLYPSPYESDMPPPQKAVPRSAIPGAIPPAGPLPVVRLGYLIPSDRTAQTAGVAKMRSLIVECRDWYRDQMDQHGFGPKSFAFETLADGVTPLVHVVPVSVTSAYLRADLWGRTIAAAQTAGLSIWASGEVWLLVPEAHVQAADGAVSGGTALGASFGSGMDPGVAMLGSDALARWGAAFATDDRAYHNLTIPEIGPFPLQQDVSFGWGEGTTLSSIASSVRGAAAHELGHAFGMPHDFRHDDNFHGNLMGNGLRGFRGAFFPARYPSDFTRLTYGSALALHRSAYFNAGQTESTPPALTILTSGNVTPANGRIAIAFNASDAVGLGAAWLTLNGDLVAELPLSGVSVSSQFSVGVFTPGVANTFSIFIFDTQGNRTHADTSIVPSSGPNRAPNPKLRITPPVALAGTSVTLDASASSDPNHSASLLTVEWDLDGDGLFDTAPTTVKTRALPLPIAGRRLVRSRLTDPAGGQIVSSAIALHAEQPTTLLSRTAAPSSLRLGWLSKVGFRYQVQASPGLSGWSATGRPLLSGHGGALEYIDPSALPHPAGFLRLLIFKASE